MQPKVLYALHRIFFYIKCLFLYKLVTLAGDIKDPSLSGPLLSRQSEDEAEHQLLGGILAQNHHVVSSCVVITCHCWVSLLHFFFKHC